MSSKKKRPGRNPAKPPHIDEHPVAKAAHRRLEAGVLLTRDLQKHITPMGDCLITLEQWRFLRGSVVADLAIYAQITGKPSPIEMIIKSEQERVLVDF
jgi:hypothetical protein